MNYKSFLVTLAASVVSAVIAAVGTVWWLGVHCNVRVADVGPGLVAYSRNNAASDSADANNETRLEILKRDDDLAFTKDGRLGFNDAVPGGNKSGVNDYNGKQHVDGITSIGYVGSAPKLVARFYRGSGYDYTIPLVVIAPPIEDKPGNDEYFAFDPATSGHPGGCSNTSAGAFIRFKGGVDFESVSGMLGIMYLHVSASGVILGIDYTPDCSACCRRTK